MSALAAAYRPRRPTETVLYALVREHLESFLQHVRESYGAPLPRYVEDELRAYLRCGVFAHGFVRARCESCDHDLIVAFSCKRRGLCPSCAGRRMANEAAALVDRVLPAVPVRQWVLSLPFELRALAAFDAKVLTALSRIFAEAVGQWYSRAAARVVGGRVPTRRAGAVTFVQRFGSSLNLNVHFHTCFLDGVYLREASGRLAFHAAPAPSREDLDAVVLAVHGRVLRWLARQGHLDRSPVQSRSNEPARTSSIEACAAVAMQPGAMRTLGGEPDAVELPGAAPARTNGHAREHAGFNLHASVRIAADDDLGRERLCRYGARPPFSVERLRRLAGGLVAYRTRKLGRGRAKHRVMTPVELLARIAALVPPPRYPLVRYHGVLAPHAAWRSEVVPRPPVASSARAVTPADASCQAAPRAAGPTSVGRPPPRDPAARPRDHGRREVSGVTAGPSAPAASSANGKGGGAALVFSGPRASVDGAGASVDVTRLSSNILTVRHWSRLLGGLLYATSPRLRWPELLRRTFDVDVLECPTCRGRLRVAETVTEATAVRQILERLAVPLDAPLPSRARDPTIFDGDPPDAA